MSEPPVPEPKYVTGRGALARELKERRERLDLWDLREEVASLSMLMNQMLGGMSVETHRKALREAANELEKGRKGEKVAVWIREFLLKRDIDPGQFLEVVRELRTTVKVMVEIEVAARKTWPADRVKRLIEEIMGVVRRHADARALDAIGEDLRALKARGGV